MPIMIKAEGQDPAEVAKRVEKFVNEFNELSYLTEGIDDEDPKNFVRVGELPRDSKYVEPGKVYITNQNVRYIWKDGKFHLYDDLIMRLKLVTEELKSLVGDTSSSIL